MLEEYADVLGDYPEFVAEVVESFPVCYPRTSSVPSGTNQIIVFSNALAANAEFIVTVNTAPAHFDRKQSVNVARLSEFLNVPEVGAIAEEAHSRLIQPPLR